MMKEIILELVEVLKQRMKKEVPEYGDFETVEQSIQNTNKNYCADIFALELVQPPKGVEGRETKRGLKVVAYNDKAGMEILMAVGTNKNILDKLKDDEFLQSLTEAMEKVDNELYHI